MSTMQGLLARGLLAAMLVLGAGTATASIDDAAVVEAVVDGIVLPLMHSNDSPSGTVAIARNGELILAKGYGFEDVARQVPVDPYQTLFRPGSASKLPTWVAVMQLVEQGKLALDTDVNEYLDTFQIHDTFPEPVTLRHIMTHTTGFEDGVLGYLILEDPAKSIPLAEAMARYQPARINPPGAQTAYSNYATALAGLIVANVSGMPFNDYIERHVFDPLEMRRSTFEEPLPPALAERMAHSYAVENGAFREKPFEIVSNFGPAGGLSATATDMVRFGEAIRNGGELDGTRILQPATTARMLSNQFSHDERLLGMGLGFYATDYNGYRVLGHGGDLSWFHSYLGIDEANALTVFVSFGGAGGSQVRTLFLPAFYNHFFPREEAPPVPPDDFAERAGRYAGSYGFWRASFTKIEKAMGLAGGISVAPSEDNTLILSMGGKAKQYAETEPNLFREVNPLISLVSGINPRLVAFQENDDGVVTGLVLDGLPFMSLRKLPLYATPPFNAALVLFSILVFIAVLLRRGYQRLQLPAWPQPDRAAFRASVLVAAVHLLTLATGVVALMVTMEQMFVGIPLALKLWLWLPIIATLVSLYLLYTTVTVWRQGLFTGVGARLRFSAVTLFALAMSWFYFYWNLLGFNYY